MISVHLPCSAECRGCCTKFLLTQSASCVNSLFSPRFAKEGKACVLAVLLHCSIYVANVSIFTRLTSVLFFMYSKYDKCFRRSKPSSDECINITVLEVTYWRRAALSHSHLKKHNSEGIKVPTNNRHHNNDA